MGRPPKSRVSKEIVWPQDKPCEKQEEKSDAHNHVQYICSFLAPLQTGLMDYRYANNLHMLKEFLKMWKQL